MTCVLSVKESKSPFQQKMSIQDISFLFQNASKSQMPNRKNMTQISHKQLSTK